MPLDIDKGVAAAETAGAAGAPELMNLHLATGEEAVKPVTDVSPGSSAAVAAELSMACTNPAALLSDLRAIGSPLLGVRVPKEISALASMIVADCDSPGIESDDLELLLRMALYFDRQIRAI